MSSPTPEEVREMLAGLDDRQQKIVAGLFTLMARNPPKVRDREWIAEHLAEVTLLSGDPEADSPQAGVRAVERYLQENGPELLRATMMLFQRVGLDLAPRADKGFDLEEALRIALGYLPS